MVAFVGRLPSQVCVGRSSPQPAYLWWWGSGRPTGWYLVGSPVGDVLGAEGLESHQAHHLRTWPARKVMISRSIAEALPTQYYCYQLHHLGRKHLNPAASLYTAHLGAGGGWGSGWRCRLG